MSKMTDEQIIKALKVCAKNETPFCCGECELGENNSSCDCVDRLLKLSLDLINRQQEAIDGLTDKLEGLLCQATGGKLSYSSYPKETMLSVANDYVNECYYEGQTEAIKEFAERLKKEIYTNIKNNTMTKSQYIAENYKCLSCDFIATSRGKNDGLKTAFKLVNNLVKEMVGEQK